MKKKEYFSHGSGARNEWQAQALMQKVGILGYGVYWFLEEFLHQTRGSYIELKEGVIASLSYQIRIEESQLNNIIEAIVHSELMYITDGRLYSRKELEGKKLSSELSIKRSEAGKASAEVRWGKKPEIVQPEEVEPPKPETKPIAKPVRKKKQTVVEELPLEDLPKQEAKAAEMKDWEFLALFNELKKILKPTSKGHTMLTNTDKTNLKNLTKAGYGREEFTAVINECFASAYVMANGLDVPGHVLINPNFLRYLNKAENSVSGSNEKFVKNR